MTPFGLRNRLKSVVKQALGLDVAPPSAAPAPTRPPPTPAPPRPAPATSPPRPSHGAPSAPAALPSDLPPGTMFVQGARLDEVLPNSCKVVTVLGQKLALYSVDGAIFATKNACPHAGGSLGEGDLDGHTITCPFHGLRYDVRTGVCTSDDAITVDTVRVKIDGGLILFEV